MERGKAAIWRSDWFNATALLVASWIAIAALSFQVRTDAEVVAVAFPPWWNDRQVFLATASANAAIVRMTALPALLVVRPDDNDGLKQLRKAGAWLTMDPRSIAACFTNRQRPYDIRSREPE